MQSITIELVPDSELVSKNLESIKSGHQVIYLPLWSRFAPGVRTLEEAAKELHNVKEQIADKKIIKVIYVPNKIINIIFKLLL